MLNFVVILIIVLGVGIVGGSEWRVSGKKLGLGTGQQFHSHSLSHASTVRRS